MRGLKFELEGKRALISMGQIGVVINSIWSLIIVFVVDDINVIRGIMGATTAVCTTLAIIYIIKFLKKVNKGEM